jgi:hypothetical protein
VATTRKVQVVLSADQYELLVDHAREQGKSVSALLRESLEHALLESLEQRRMQAAFERLTGQRLPVADWEEIERDLHACCEG